MGLFTDIFKKAPSIQLPDTCSEQVYEAISETLKWAQQWHESVVVSVTPGSADGNVTYRNQSGLVVLWWESDLLDPSFLLVDHYIQDHFRHIVDDNGNDNMVFYCPLPDGGIGKESVYISHFVERLKIDYPEAKLTIGSSGRQLTLLLPS